MTNLLQNEHSPYLQQHAQNPVHWMPWGEEAFQKARAEDKPVFLSIGYATCHWCHVMAHESFEDAEVAAALNAAFVCIKVDREERPDIDQVYMKVCQMMAGHGGWPLTVVMTPEQKPFFAGTYFPKHTRKGRVGMLDLVAHLQDLWHNQREKITMSSEKITELLNTSLHEPGMISAGQLIGEALKTLQQNYDPVYGGFQEAPKFPTPHQFGFLLRAWLKTEDAQDLNMVTHTLQQMRLGGIFDQLGFGFHRYSTDRQWLLPHFEKMLYDQGLLTLAYLEAFQASQTPVFAQVAHEINAYLLREMRHPDGGFYCAQDADSEGEEGKYYIWKQSELQQRIQADHWEWFTQTFEISEQGNYKDEATHQTTGNNVLKLKENLPQSENWEALKNQLLEHRQKRVVPETDDKILSDWNGLIIASLAESAFILDSADDLAAARQCADFLKTRLTTQEGRLLHRYHQGNSAITGMLDDYVFVIFGLLKLFQSSFQAPYLEWALQLQSLQDQHFWDANQGGYFFTADDAQPLIVRHKEWYDGALPAGNSIAYTNLLTLFHLTGEPGYGEKAEQLKTEFMQHAEHYPAGHTQFLQGLLTEHSEVVICVNEMSDAEPYLQVLKHHFAPGVFRLVVTPENRAELEIHLPSLKDKVCLNNKPTVYLCQHMSCSTPVHEVAEFENRVRHLI